MLETIIVAVISLIAGGLSSFLFFPQLKREKNIENESKQSDEWKKLYEEEKAMLAECNAKIDTLYETISNQRDAKADLANANAELRVENTRLCLLKCEVPGCAQRTPPTGF